MCFTAQTGFLRNWCQNFTYECSSYIDGFDFRSILNVSNRRRKIVHFRESILLFKYGAFLGLPGHTSARRCLVKPDFLCSLLILTLHFTDKHVPLLCFNLRALTFHKLRGGRVCPTVLFASGSARQVPMSYGARSLS